MKAKGQIAYGEIPLMFQSAIRLDHDKIEKGDVYKATIDKSKKYSIEMLFVAPNSSVSMHQHVDDYELYIDLNSGCVESCSPGQSHELVNISSNRWLVVLSIKRRCN